MYKKIFTLIHTSNFRSKQRAVLTASSRVSLFADTTVAMVTWEAAEGREQPFW